MTNESLILVLTQEDTGKYTVEVCKSGIAYKKEGIPDFLDALSEAAFIAADKFTPKVTPAAPELCQEDPIGAK